MSKDTPIAVGLWLLAAVVVTFGLNWMVS